jgi:hypothetical protein
MSISFHCTCGRRLRARKEIAGRAVRCPQCGAALTVPVPGPAEPTRSEVAEPVTTAEPESPFAFETGETERGSVAESVPPASEAPPVVPAESEAVTLPWLSPDSMPPVAPAPEPPRAPDGEPDPALAALVVADVGPIRPSAGRPRAATEAEPTRALGEPWYLSFAASMARFVLVCAVALSAAVPGAVLVGALVALARTGDPRALGAWTVGGVRVVWLLVGALAVFGLAAVLWAAPMLALADQARRSRVLGARLDEVLRRLEKPREGSADGDAANPAAPQQINHYK